MANTLKIKRSTSTATPSSLSEGELAYSENSNKLFIGTSGGNMATIAGTYTANDFTDALKTKLDGVASSANNYSLTAATASALGGIKVGTNLSIASGILSSTDTTYSDATTSVAGLMSSTDKTNHNSVYSWYSTMTTADGDSIINTVNEIVSAFEGHAEGLNLITELDAKLTASSTIDGGTF